MIYNSRLKTKSKILCKELKLQEPCFKQFEQSIIMQYMIRGHTSEFMNYEAKLIKRLEDRYIYFFAFMIINIKDMNFSFYSKYVIFSCMPIDETIQMARQLHETHLV
jgi:hypothetical protein